MATLINGIKRGDSGRNSKQLVDGEKQRNNGVQCD